MRDFETDFEFNIEVGVRAVRTKAFRKDVYKAVTADKTEWTDNAERKARIASHTERIQREMQELGITKGSQA